MTASKAVIIDGVLKELGDRLFYDPVRPMKPRRNIKGVKVASPSKTKRYHIASPSARTRSFLDKTARKVPEVMVKISGGGKGIMQIKAHLDYVSRNGDVPLEDQNGDTIHGKEAVRDLRDEWRYGGIGITRESTVKQAFNIVLSMPPGTDRAAVTNAAREFAKDEFSDNFSYVFATHADEKHPHVHLAVKAMGRDGTRLNPRKADLQRWREMFADKLRDNGIEANATKRPVRGVTRKPRKQPVIHMEKRGVRSLNRIAQTKSVAEQIRTGRIVPNPYQDNIIRTRASVESSLLDISNALNTSGEVSDVRLSEMLKKHVKQLPAIQTAREAAVKEVIIAKERAGRSKEQGDKNK